MVAKKLYNPKIGEFMHSSVYGVSKIIRDFAIGSVYMPFVTGFVPTTVRCLKNSKAREKKESVVNTQDRGKLWEKMPFTILGAANTGLWIGYFSGDIYQYVKEHPYTLAIPIVTNIFSAGYEKYRADKIENLESKVSKDKIHTVL